MTTLLPVALWGLEVPPEVPVFGEGEFPAAFRITMAAIDPSEEVENEDGAKPRATLKIHRMPMGLGDDDSDDSDDDDDDSFDQEEMERILAEEESSEDDDEVNGGPSDPARKKAAKEVKMVVDVDEDIANGINGIVKSAKAKGKMPASDEDEDDDDDDDEDGSDLDIEPETFVLCTLDPEKHYQQPLDIVVGEGERVWFEVSGTHTIYLTGNYVEPDYDNTDMFDPDDDDEEDYDLEPDLDELDDDDEDELDDLKDPRIMELDEDDSAEEKDTPKLIATKDKKNNKKRPAEDDAAEEKTLDEMIEKEKLSKKQQKKLKKNDGSAAAVKADDKAEPSSAKSDKKVSFAKNLEQGPTPTKVATTDAAKPAAGGKKTIQGVEVDDKKLGTGPAAKTGDRVGMRYIGKLAAGGQQFDANKKGKPFSFKLGAGVVIKGWEIGIQGMSVGGERRITIPPHLGYGAKRHGDIPPNSTLVFDVKLIELNKGK